MPSSFETRLSRLTNSSAGSLLAGGKIGLEKESLRQQPDGHIAQTPHPQALGSALTHPYITTDYSEALLEFITPPLQGVRKSLEFLDQLHRFTYSRLDDELIWATSMPCIVEGEHKIPIARYGSSPEGLMKHIYRRGLGYRYGHAMQVIAGVHFNYSFADDFWPQLQELWQDRSELQDFISTSYFRLLRNLHRYGWVLYYLFGASPAACKSFFGDYRPKLSEYNETTWYEPFATTLRMSDVGYTNRNIPGMEVSYDSLEAYIATLRRAVETPHPEYQRIGVCVNGEYRQLNANILQIENEYYSAMRAKQLPQNGEKPIHALQRRGVAYVELRSLDVNPFEPVGVGEAQARFLSAFMAYCLLQDSPPLGNEEQSAIRFNLSQTAIRGRDPALRLNRNGKEESPRDWGMEICEQMTGITTLLDQARETPKHTEALTEQQEAFRDPDRTPSARILAAMDQDEGSFFHFARHRSESYQDYFQSRPLPSERETELEQLSKESLRQQKEMEARPAPDFKEYLANYFGLS